MRRRAKIDRNQPEIVAALRKVGCSVQSLAEIGSGCPDLLVAKMNHTFLLEVKDGERPPSQRQLTPDQVRWRQTWKGDVFTVETVQEALNVVTFVTGEKP